MIHSLGSNSEWYRGVLTDDLVMLVHEAEEKSEYCPDAAEQHLWKERLASMQDELVRRQELLDAIEV